jgi:hypothetical protein
MNEQLTSEEFDCDEGCDERPHKHKWEIEPHPHNSDFDVLVCDDDKDAWDAAFAALESAWDDCGLGEERVIKIRRNKVADDE